jgi:NADPH-dependent curcumin reductase CurA
VLVRYPEGAVVPTDIMIEQVPVTEPADGEVLVRRLMTSADHYIDGLDGPLDALVALFRSGTGTVGTPLVRVTVPSV